MPARRFLAGLLASAVTATGAHAQEADDDEEETPEYSDAGSIELGGTASFAWDEDVFAMELGPSVGVFVVDGFEISALLRGRYVEEDGESGQLSGTLVGEPSYHLPISAETLYAFAGYGVGVAYDGEDANFEMIPRVGLNVMIGESGVLTPAARMPIIFESDEDPSLGVVVEVGLGTTF